ncbi:hypothetical protein [Amycolatopsis alkalitolerans]|uniref:Uncharacterized protein n=1 Tax=Amycolatopsis alkalitolerans TaxID=2547244 RepID=A0A5C4LWM7_9PSEU|nr:hypothetical protein [Amycolatopsis alkalitolerans]TNC21091.1 hypothetical protein FG385_29355 [Amycolatopsis alkalitolerans]
MTTPETGETGKGRQPRMRGRGWLLSSGAILSWEAAFLLFGSIAFGPPSGDAWYFTVGPQLAMLLLFGTPVTYLVAWRRPRPFLHVLLWALPVFVVLLGVTRQSW